MTAPKTVYVHIGLAKTGTTSLQLTLQENAGGLADRGILYPGGTHGAQSVAVFDLVGRSMPGESYPRLAGAFDRVVREIDAWPGPAAVVSHELLALARPRQVQRLVTSLSGHRLVVVVTVRDLARALCSSYQQEVFQGSVETWGDYLRHVRDQRAASGLSFWMRQDLTRVLRTWERVVPREDIVVVTVPPPSQPAGVLFERFEELLGLPPDWLASRRERRNGSLDRAELEVLRRLNDDIATKTGRSRRVQHVPEDLRGQVASTGSRPLRLPASDLSWVCARSASLVQELTEGGYRIVGDVAELIPHEPATGSTTDDMSEAELLAATSRLLRAVTIEHAALVRQHRRLRQRLRTEPTEHSLAVRLRYAGRTLGFRGRHTAVLLAGRSRPFAWLGQVYLRRTGSR
jgi:hypothetical protein